MQGLEVQIGDALMVSEFVATNEKIRLGFNAGEKRRFVMLLLGEQDVKDDFDPEAMLNALGWERKEINDEPSTGD